MENVFQYNAMALGQMMAEAVGKDDLPLIPEQVRDVANQYHVRVKVIPTGDRNANPKVRAIYDRNRRSIIIEEASLQSFQAACQAIGLGPVSRCDVLAMHIAHELFHHLEEIGEVPFSLYYRLEWNACNRLFAFGNLRSKISQLYTGPPLGVLREIAAHSFVAKLLGLAVSPAWIEKMASQRGVRDT